MASREEIQPDILAAAQALASFAGKSLTARIGGLEQRFSGATAEAVQRSLSGSDITHELLLAASVMKRVAGQINVTIHAIGILLCLPHILAADERVESLSLGAGNTGRAFDLETDRQIAEFKFIHWQGGAETIRQNALFKDLYQMIEHPSPKKKFMYVLGTEFPMKFLTGGRALNSVMSRNRKLWDSFVGRYGNQFSTVGDYYADRGHEVELVDVSAFVPALASLTLPGPGSADSDAGAS
jgi:hypothetical protein